MTTPSPSPPSSPLGGQVLLPNAEAASRFWQTASNGTILIIGAFFRSLLYGLNKAEVHGLENFLSLLKSRQDYRQRQRGLLTISNHLSVLDEPFIWGVIPNTFTYSHLYNNHRWSLGSHDVCFKNVFTSYFFTLGQTMPTYRLIHSKFGGPYQATITQAVRLMSRIDGQGKSLYPAEHIAEREPKWRDCVDPFSDLPVPSYRPSPESGSMQFLAPSRYASNSYSWVHAFPEGMIHQSPTREMRYFKWGFTRLILEPPECPDLVPMFIEGTDQIMHESRSWPRFIPRMGATVHVTFGERVDREALFGDLRKAWRELQSKQQSTATENPTAEKKGMSLGIIEPSFQNNAEAQTLRMECARRVRNEVLKIRRSRGYPDDDPKASYAETWLREGPKQTGEMKDGTWVGDT